MSRVELCSTGFFIHTFDFWSELVFEKIVDPIAKAGMSPELMFGIYLASSLFLLISIGIFIASAKSHRVRMESYYGEEYEETFNYRKPMIVLHCIVVAWYILNLVLLDPERIAVGDFSDIIIKLVSLSLLATTVILYFLHIFVLLDYLPQEASFVQILSIFAITGSLVVMSEISYYEFFDDPSLIKNTYGLLYLAYPTLVFVVTVVELKEMFFGYVYPQTSSVAGSESDSLLLSSEQEEQDGQEEQGNQGEQSDQGEQQEDLSGEIGMAVRLGGGLPSRRVKVD